MKYAYEDLSDKQFENLVILLCQRLLGMGVQGFATGPDGGKDGKFVGVAESIPSKASPWKGVTIIQAKHTEGYNRSFSELDFFNPEAKQSILGDEIPRIKDLRVTGRLDNYILFSNRKISAGSEALIRSYIAIECLIPEENILLVGVEQIEMYLKVFPQISAIADLSPIDSPLLVSPDDLADVVEAFARQRESIIDVIESPPTQRVSFERKNELNNMTLPYAKEYRRRYLKEAGEIRQFLASPENLELLQMYESITEEFQLRILSKRQNHNTFDEVMEHLARVLFSRDAVLRQQKHKKITRAMLFYMYWNCDIGEVDDVAAP